MSGLTAETALIHFLPRSEKSNTHFEHVGPAIREFINRFFKFSFIKGTTSSDAVSDRIGDSGGVPCISAQDTVMFILRYILPYSLKGVADPGC